MENQLFPVVKKKNWSWRAGALNYIHYFNRKYLEWIPIGVFTFTNEQCSLTNEHKHSKHINVRVYLYEKQSILV